MCRHKHIGKRKSYWYCSIAVAIAGIGVLIWLASCYWKEVNCKANLKGIQNALQTYHNEFGDYPIPEKWYDALIDAGFIGKEHFQCPIEASAVHEGHYVLNSALGKSSAGISGDFVLVFEGRSGWNQVGGREKAVFRHRGKCGVVFLNGQMEMLEADILNRLLGDTGKDVADGVVDEQLRDRGD